LTERRSWRVWRDGGNSTSSLPQTRRWDLGWMVWEKARRGNAASTAAKKVDFMTTYFVIVMEIVRVVRLDMKDDGKRYERR
jgi:hypothetical protein